MTLLETLDQLRSQLQAGTIDQEAYRQQALVALETLARPYTSRWALRGPRMVVEGVVTLVRPQHEDVLALVEGTLVWLSLKGPGRELQIGDRVRLSGHQTPYGVFAVALDNQTRGYRARRERRMAWGLLIAWPILAALALILVALGYYSFGSGIGPGWLRGPIAGGCVLLALVSAKLAVAGLWSLPGLWRHIRAVSE